MLVHQLGYLPFADRSIGRQDYWELKNMTHLLLDLDTKDHVFDKEHHRRIFCCWFLPEIRIFSWMLVERFGQELAEFYGLW